MGTNNDHKVSNLTVGPHRNSSLNILNSITNITEAPLLYRVRAAIRGYFTPSIIQEYFTMKKKTIARNYKILHEAATTLASLRDKQRASNEMTINQIQVHLVDELGDGIVLCLEYDELVDGELNKTFHSMEEYYDEVEGVVEIELEGNEDEVEFEDFHELQQKRKREPLLN